MTMPAKSSTAHLAAVLERAPRFSCAHLPTPLQPLKRLSAHLKGPNLWIKRDDCTGLATGGNKARKLEYLIGDAISKGADTVITHGALQSNHVRQTAAAAAMAGMDCEVLYEHRVDPNQINNQADQDYVVSGNVLLTGLLGAKRNEYPKDTDMDAAMATRANALQADGKQPYLIPGGGSNPIGAMGYANCALELTEQAAHLGLCINHLVHATGSTGTQAGLVAGCHAMHLGGDFCSGTSHLGGDFFSGASQWPFPILGIGVRLPRQQQEQKVFDLARATAAHLGIKQALLRESVQANCDYVGAGYGIPTDGMLEAVSLLARLEGILLDPVYSGKGMAGLIDLVRKGFFSSTDNVVFIHTGGSAALFGYRTVFIDDGTV